MGAKINILVVDDEQIVLDSIKKHLRREERFAIHTALSAQEALDIMDSGNIQIVLTDLMMPEIDGLELLKIIQDKHENTIPIMITGYATINSALQANQLGAFDYLAKPFTRDELKKVVKRAAGLTEAYESAPKEKEKSSKKFSGNLKGIGEHSWLVRQRNGDALIGVEKPFVYGVGEIKTVYLPEKGDELRQGSVYFQAFSSDLRSQSLLSPLSGTVTEVNEKVLKNPNEALKDPYGEGWLIKLSPYNFDEEIKLVGVYQDR